jgi:glyoxalase/bleomycin resistance protein/dioxygenase superfamily protein
MDPSVELVLAGFERLPIGSGLELSDGVTSRLVWAGQSAKTMSCPTMGGRFSRPTVTKSFTSPSTTLVRLGVGFRDGSAGLRMTIVGQVNTMKLEHVAIWAVDLDRMRTFYEKYFDARSNLKYENESKRFTSYFLTFPGGGRLELMHRPDIQRIQDSESSHGFIGYAPTRELQG